MLVLSHDPEAGTLYVYFTELQAGQVTDTLEYAAALLLDAAGHLVGLRLDLDDELTLAQLELALDGDFTRLNMSNGQLTLPLVNTRVAQVVPLAATALLDLAADETLLGIEIAVPAEQRSPESLALVAHLLVDLDDAAPSPGDGPVVFAPPSPADEFADDEPDDDEPFADDDLLADDELSDDESGDDDNEPLADDEPGDDDKPNAADSRPAVPPAAVPAQLDAPGVPDAAQLGADHAGRASPASVNPALTPSHTARAAPAQFVPAAHASAPAHPPVADAPAPLLRSGFVALVGKPNVGKSTLLNALLGQKLAIVSPQPQTTRVPARGILSRPDAQIIFVDTPGIHQPSHALGRLMVDLAEQVLPNSDVIGFMVDLSQPPAQLDRQIAQQVQRARGHKLLILNKVDQRPRGANTNLEAYRSLGPWDFELAISARRRLGLVALLDAIVARLPLGPALYPLDQVTDQSVQHLAAEFVREKVLYHTHQEVPHAVAVEVEEWEPRDQTLFMRMTINVERDGQKAIIIGAGGAMLKKIGSAARFEIERMLERPVYLELWVKVRPGWRDDVAALGWLGYRAKDWR